MIIVIDDDPIILELIENLLKKEGYEIKTFSSAIKAIEFIRDVKPSLIISDIMMPNMSGFELKQKVNTFYNVPFIFVSSLNDDENINKAFEMEIDDYITKPINLSILKAKVKKLLTSQAIKFNSAFFGDLSKMSFIKIFQFCENHKITGTVNINSKNKSYTIYFIGGEIDEEKTQNYDEVLDEVSELQEGTFKISQKLADFSKIENAKLEIVSEIEEKPMGSLSSITVGEKTFQIQTEYTSVPKPTIVTIVVYNGKTVIKTSKTDINNLSKEKLESLIKSQHHKVEEKVREKLSEIQETKQKKEPSIKEMCATMFDQGLDKYMAKQYEKAYEIWSKVYEIEPNNKVLKTNLEILRKKLKID